ncbi:hypothetical protein LCGC14_0397420 [marine sediment metagenome]|uniref:Uncharacterized protein n=1 Tax=marine sediment metagenome TaxID=412755 RepID=A0A0F9T3Q1_9ZZZZ
METIFDYGYHIVENFNSNDSVADANVGDMNWEIDIISAGAETLSYGTQAGETYLRATGAGGGAADGSVLSLADDSCSAGPNGGYFRFRYRIPNISANTIANNLGRFGLNDVVTTAEPVVGMNFEFDTNGVMSFDSMSANGDVTTSFSASKLTSSTTHVLGTTNNVELIWSGNNGNAAPGPDTLVCYINGQLAGRQVGTVLLDGDETFEPKMAIWTDGSTTLETDVFGFEAASFLAK